MPKIKSLIKSTINFLNVAKRIRIHFAIKLMESILPLAPHRPYTSGTKLTELVYLAVHIINDNKPIGAELDVATEVKFMYGYLWSPLEFVDAYTERMKALESKVILDAPIEGFDAAVSVVLKKHKLYATECMLKFINTVGRGYVLTPDYAREFVVVITSQGIRIIMVGDEILPTECGASALVITQFNHTVMLTFCESIDSNTVTYTGERYTVAPSVAYLDKCSAGLNPQEINTSCHVEDSQQEDESLWENEADYDITADEDTRTTRPVSDTSDTFSDSSSGDSYND